MPGRIQPPTLQVSTAALPEPDRLPFWREQFGRKLVHCEFEPFARAGFHSRMEMRALPGLRLISVAHSPMRIARNGAHLADGDDDLVLQISMAGNISAQRGREIRLDPGQAALFSNADACTFTSHTADAGCTLLSLSYQELRPLLGDFDGAVMRPVSVETHALQLLKSYVGVFGEATLTPEFERMAVRHVYDLVAAMLGAKSEAAELAERRGLRSARLRAAKDYVTRHLGSHLLTPALVAAHLGVTPRYLHKLFAAEGISFGQFVLDRRLGRAHCMLADPRCAGLSITQISLDAGFGDLSTFNRNFRRRFGCTPTECRNAPRA